MSEEILKALMQLFALIIKQGSGAQAKEIEFVSNFIKEQLNEEDSAKYLELFNEYAELNSPDRNSVKKKTPSVKDSVAILSICKKINRTLTQQQKVVVIIRLLELVHAEHKHSPQRMIIINTVSEVFNISSGELNNIELFVRNIKLDGVETEEIIELKSKEFNHELTDNSLKETIRFIKVNSVGLYFLRHNHTNTVLLNGLATHPGKIYLFASGNTLQPPQGKPVYFSDIISRFRSKDELLSINLEAKDISFRFSNGLMGIQHISFSENQGKLVGILGSSGAGKTTLLNVLNGTEKPSEGQVLINGIDLYSGKKRIKGVIGNVPQDDLLIEELTVFQNLYYSARLCFGDKNKAEITKLVNNTLESVGLGNKKDLKVGKPTKNIISGGERKRLNVALELIREPSILFVDEPTSGLSSRDSENIMDLLRELSQNGKLIFVVIHQPSSELFKLFDNVLILDYGGQMVYYGNPIESVIYLKRADAQINSDSGECPTCGNVNPEMIFNIIEKKVVDELGRYTSKRKVNPEKWAENFKKQYSPAILPNPTNTLPVTLKIPGWIKQFKIFVSRDVLAKISNRQYVALNLLEAPILGFILSYVIYYIADPESSTYIFRENDNIPVYIFMSIIAALFLALSISAEEIFKDQKILKREIFLNLHRSAYLGAKIFILFSISGIQVFLLVIVGNTILGIKDMNQYYWIALFTTAAFGNLLGLNISSSFNSAITIYIIIPLLIIPMMVLSGAMFSFDKLNRTIGNLEKVPLIAELMPSRWTYEALMVHQFKNNKYEKYFFDLEKKESQLDFELAHRIPKLSEANEINYSLFMSKNLSEKQAGKLNLIQNEISNELQKVPEIPYSYLQALKPDSFDENIAIETKLYLDKLTTHYGKALAIVDKKIESKIQYMLEKDPSLYQELKDDYYNESVSDIVKKRFERNRILEYDNKLLQQYHPVYQDPKSNSLFNFRTHFFAPSKHFMGTFFDTFWFNIMVIWFMSLVLCLTLYFDLLKNTIQYFESGK